MRSNKLIQTIFLLPIVVFLLSCEGTDSTDAYDTKKDGQIITNTLTKEEDKRIHEFVKKAVSDGMMEIRMAEIAIKKSTNDSIRALANIIKNDHQKANTQLKNLAETNNWEIPENMLDKHQQKINKLQEVSQDEFDKEYLEMMVKGHGKAIETFQETETSASDDEGDDMTDLNSWIDETLPVLKDHKQKAKKLKKQLNYQKTNS